MDALFNLLNTEYWGNTVLDFLISLGIFIGSMVILMLFRRWIMSYLKKLTERTETTADDFALNLFERTLLPLFYVGSFYLAVMHLELPADLELYLMVIVKIILTFQVVRMVLALVVLLLQKTWLKRETAQSKVSKSIVTVMRIVVWSVAVIFLLDNLGFDVNSVIAGLGIGGVAVALAAQTVLGDLFSYFVIFFDKPFREGDFIIVGDFMGVIEHIGIKTTRIRSLSGEQLVFSNSDLTSSRLKNYMRMEQRRVSFKLGVIYQTPAEKVERIPSMIEAIIKDIELTRFDRAHFSNFAASSMDFEVVYYVMTSDYNRYMDIQQKINLRILRGFEEEGIQFAYPTQTLFVNSAGES